MVAFHPQMPFIDFVSLHDVACKVIRSFSYFGLLWSGCVLSCALAERFVSIAFPLKTKVWKMMRICKIANLVSFLISICTVGIVAYSSGLENSICVPYSHLAHLTFVAFMYLLVLNTVFTLILFVLSVMVAIQLYKFKHLRTNISNTQESNREFKMTVMLFVVSVLFTFSRTPNLITFYMFEFFELSPTVLKATLVARHFAHVLIVSNHAFNFFIYSTFNERFRAFFWRRKRREARMNSHLSFNNETRMTGPSVFDTGRKPEANSAEVKKLEM